MNMLLALYDRVSATLASVAPGVLPTLARLGFAGVLLVYFWNSARTKVGDGIFGILFPRDGAYIQIFPKAVEAVGYDVSQLGVFHYLVVLAGTLAELTLPALILVGLFTRLAALGMMGFVVVQSLTDVYGHGIGGSDLGSWFDRASDALILDQRALWMVLLSILVFLGAGPLSLDRLFARARAKARGF
ncbi:DoxX family membrane protein [Defluviimonas sp. WL0002]|uniref:DoxX family membrane protein n=1 Tax=Albidovulum marisflavi TaxID=2984159 RepID=A0ABT2ZAN9_9RHOB|nr:DoxX family membrane protein [Defluviimonas sp. WL0002]MCV2868199.1 DoxX family membrane protein [Defluviimonas sp. WL0002]